MFRRKEFWGIIMLIIGVLLLLSNLDFIDYSIQRIIHDFWPALLVIVGIYLIVRALSKKEDTDNLVINITSSDGNRVGKKYSQAFGDLKLETRDMEVDGLDTSITFGDTFISLVGAKLNPGINYVSLSSSFGDITVIIPERMEVLAAASNTFGDLHILDKMVDGLSNHLSAQTAGYSAAESKVNIRANGVFGDIRIYRG
jgi:predicted membrane protein